MRFVVDAQLPPALARWLAAGGHISEHVADVGMASADDRDIWDYVVGVGAVILSKDQDFAIRRMVASPGPQIVWIRRGNTSRRELLRWFAVVFPDLLEALARGESLIEIY